MKTDNQYFFKMFRFMKPYAIRYAISQLVYSAQGFAMPFIIAIFTGNIMAAILAGDSDAVVSAGIILAVMIGGFVLMLLFAVYANIIVIEKAMLDLKRQLFRAFMQTGLEETTHSGEDIAAINTDANTAQEVFESPLMMFLSNIITILGATIVILIMDWRLGLASIAVGIISFLIQRRFTEPLAKIGKERLDTNADAVKAASNTFSGAMAIRAYNMQSQALLTFDRENQRLKALDIRQGLIRMGQNLFGTVEGWMTLAVVFGFGGWLAATGRLEFHLLAAVFVMSSSLTSSIGSLGAVYANLQPPIAGAKRVFAILEKENSPAEQSKILKDIKLDINKNEMVAIIGESGSGKSTLLKTIIGLIESEKIDVIIDGQPISEIPAKTRRQTSAYVDQSCKLFDMSIKENIAMGKGGKASEATIEAEITTAAKQAFAHDFIQELEDGYNSPCGEQGNTLSGGQKQRIAIARALIKNAQILAFDEVTSALDAESEKYVMETINALRGKHTILIVTHNPESITSADRIITMENGRIL